MIYSQLLRTVCLVALLVAATFTATFAVTSSANLLEKPLTAVDRDVPEFALLDINGDALNPEALLGKTWLINFWAVWCAPCLEELPELNNAWAQLKDHDVGMLAINIGEEADQIGAFLAKHNLRIDFPIVIGDKIKTLGNWSGTGLPYTVVVSPQGKVVYQATGPREWDKPLFIDTVLAVKNTASSNGFASRVAGALSSFHALTVWNKVLIVLALLGLAVALVFLIRRLHRRQSGLKPTHET